MRCAWRRARSGSVVDVALSRSDLLAAATDALRGAGCAEPRREAGRLWTAMHGAGGLLRGEEAVEPVTAADFRLAVARRAAGEPLAYVVGWTGFRRLRLVCDRRALIPRPETESVIDVALARRHDGVAADVGTGTGALALALRDEGGVPRRGRHRYLR